MNCQILTRSTEQVEINTEGGPTRQTALAEHVFLIMCLVTISLNAPGLLGMMSHAGLPAIQATTLRHRELGTHQIGTQLDICLRSPVEIGTRVRGFCRPSKRVLYTPKG